MTTEEDVIYSTDIITTVVLRPNCSIYNPCGKYGYCADDLNAEWKCLCKFWWTGTLCNELSSSGKQVITLGVLVGILLGIFYGLTIFRSIRKKRKLSKVDSKENIPTIKRIFPSVDIKEYHPSRRFLSYITGILTLFLALGTLIAKWRIIKPIHEEIVEKFHNNQTLFFKRHSICKIIDLSPDFNLFTFPVACLLIILFIIITKRISLRQYKYFKGYIGIPIPVDFFAHVKRTLVAVIFAIFADELLEIVTTAIFGGGVSSNKGIIVAYLIQISKVFVIGIRRYPILAAVYIDNCFSLICATLYIWLDYSITILYSGLCKNDFYPNEDKYNDSYIANITLTYYGTGSKLIFLQLLTDIPRYLCLAYISIKLPILLIKRIYYRKSFDQKLTREKRNLLYSSLPYSTESRYVKKLLNINKTQLPTNRFTQIFQYIYEWRDDFRFSSRIIGLYAAIFLMLFFLTTEACISIPPILYGLRQTLQALIDMTISIINPPDPTLLEIENRPSDFPIPNLSRACIFAIFISLLITIIQLLIMLANIRRNLLQSFRGDDCEIPRRISNKNINYITGNFHFAGYLIGYIMLCYVLLFIISFLIGIGIDAFITYGNVKFLEQILKGLIPLILFPLFKVYLDKFLGQYIFLQHGGEVLSINNRRTFMVFIYFNFFLDAFLGLIAAFIRLFKSIIGAVIYMCRLDYSPLGRKLETMDAGFNAYCGFIYMECAHRHPVLLCFVSHLLRDNIYSKTKRLSKAKHKWLLAVFLIKNPILVYRRKGFLMHIQQNETRLSLIGKENMNDMYIEQPPILAHRGSIVSIKELEDLWERRRF